MKTIITLLLLVCFAVSLSGSDISGDLEFWKMRDFLGFDEVGDCKGESGDITSVFAKIENKQMFIRVTFDDMAKDEPLFSRRRRISQETYPIPYEILRTFERQCKM